MIKVQALRGAPQSGQPTREDYVEPEKEKPGFLPQAFLVFLAGVAVYLKSFLPGSLEAAPEPRPKAGLPEQGAAGGEPEPVAVARDTAAEEAKGSSDNVVPLQPRKLVPREAVESFLASNSPSIDFSRGGPIASPLQGRASNDNGAATPPPARMPDPDPAPGRGGGAGGGNDGEGRRQPDAPAGRSDPATPDQETRNRAPRVNGPVRLQDLVGCNAYFIPVLALLAGATDADGDTLRTAALIPSSGTLTPVEGGWRYTPDRGMLGEVTLRYRISDGIDSVEQVATFAVVEAPPIIGTAGDDTLLGTACGEVIDGREGDDLIDARGGSDTILGGDGDDNIVAGAGNDTVYAGAGHDIVFAGPGHDIVFGGPGHDRLFGEDGNDTLLGEQGDDLLVGGAGDDIVQGGEGNDELRGDAGTDKLDGGAGDDRLEGGDDRDVLVGGDGDDVLTGDEGDDVLADGAGSDSARGGAGDDHVVAAADAAPDSYFGDEGEDTLDYSAGVVAIAVDVGAGTAEGLEIGRDLIDGFERIIGGRGDDRLTAIDSSATLTGGAGNDTFAFGRSDDDHQPDLVRKITDFTVGDRLLVASYEIRYREGEDLDEEIEDLFEDIYLAEDSDDRPVRFRFEELESGGRTIVDVHDREDSEDYYSIELAGRHELQLFVGITQQQQPENGA